MSNEPVHGERFIPRALHELVIQHLQPLAVVAENDVVIEAVERATDRRLHIAALGGVRVDVVEMFIIRRIARLAVHGDGVGGSVGGCRKKQQGKKPG